MDEMQKYFKWKPECSEKTGRWIKSVIMWVKLRIGDYSFLARAISFPYNSIVFIKSLWGAANNVCNKPGDAEKFVHVRYLINYFISDFKRTKRPP